MSPIRLASITLDRPVIQAPMAGVSTPALAAAVSNAGGLGSLGLGAMNATEAAAAIGQTRGLTDRPFGVNLFCHAPAHRDPGVEASWLNMLAPRFAAYGASPPPRLTEIYPSFLTDDAMLRVLCAARPALVSFHFGLPDAARLQALRDAGAVLGATVTSAAEAQAIVAAGLDLVIAQGWEAGGHRGLFDPAGADARLALPDLLASLRGLPIPVVAAGAIMRATDTRDALAAGAVAVQCGTAFLRAPEAATTAAHRAALSRGETTMTRAISGRPARSISNLLTAIDDAAAPDYPVAYDAAKALNAAALAAGETGYGAQWAGTGAAQAVARPAADTVAALTPRPPTR
ncbi:nitronate monooxygenase [uncultured Paracoccus sp.]|uniref:NAD(P)H-dependent flavin oxidoreductase n=1 Tax=uncultured Paracoccus sp. TaxID=189685 RepID=UPI00263883EB|nr:nitronate monooxygenase [uncultured Paracoccus sp.]